MRLGNEPLACPVAARFSSFMVSPCRASASCGPQTGTLANFIRVRCPSSRCIAVGKLSSGQPLAVDAHAAAVRAAQVGDDELLIRGLLDHRVIAWTDVSGSRMSLS